VTSIGSFGAVSPARDLEPRQWPSHFDDWMMDIVRRRALRLNSGARRRGVHGTVRAVDLAYILDKSADAEGRWRCALCHGVVTLNDLSFDHVVALADGGEHAPHNLVPAHRKCNEIKGSEKAQYRAQALDRWLSEWAAGPAPLTARSSGSTAAHGGPRRGAPMVSAVENSPERRYA
jgi:5-methylcytosine-specific restriction endonuclease McrA